MDTTKRLTKTVCDAFKYEGRTWEAADGKPRAERCIVWDAVQPGLGLRVSPKGRKTWVLRYKASGRKRMMTLGRYGQQPVDTLQKARDKAKAELGRVVEGADPLEEQERVRDIDTFNDAAQSYFENREQLARSGGKINGRRFRLSSVATARVLWGKHVPDALKRRRIVDVTRGDIQGLLNKIVDRPATYNRARTVLHAIFEHAISVDSEGKIEANPVARVQRIDATPQKPREALTADELGRLGRVLSQVEQGERIAVGDKSKSITPAAAHAIRLFALTGMRRSELLGHQHKAYRGEREGLRWADVDLEARTYTLAAVGGGSGGKSTKPRTLPLGAAAVALLREVRPKGAGPETPVIASPRDPSAPLVGIDNPRRYIYQAAGIDGKDLHSLRHTFETMAYREAPSFAGALTGRAAVKDAVLNNYIDPAEWPLHDVADAVTARIARALDGEDGTVVEFQQGAAING